MIIFQHGESDLNQEQRIGGDSSLSANGKLVSTIAKVPDAHDFCLQYAEALANYMDNGK